MHKKNSEFFNALGARARAAGWHLSVSLVIAAAAAILVFGYWYPGDYRILAGGTDLFFIVMAVDVVMGPLLTFVVFDRSKGVPHLRRDILVIAVMQLIALSYGVHAMYWGRPVGLAFEFDRFRVVSLAEVVLVELPQAPPMYRRIPLDGPMLLAVRKSNSPEERADAMKAAITLGVDNSQRPKFWIPYDDQARARAVAIGRPLSVLSDRYPSAKDEIDRMHAAVEVNENRDALRFLPVRAKRDAVVVLKSDGGVVGFVYCDGFF